MEVDTFKGSIVEVSLVLEQLSRVFTMYECLTVADYNDIIGINSTYSDSKMGWLSLDGFRIAETDKRGVYELKIPKVLRIE